MKRKFPNLFVIGAPKCGTTSLAHWLSEHPQIYFYIGIGKEKNSKVEPNYWASDLNLPNRFKREEYFNLFRSIDGSIKYVGEASPWYLFSKTAIKNIENNIESPKYIVSIRNPVDMAFSLWLQTIRSGLELCIDDFLKAFNFSELRIKGKPVYWNSRLADPKLGAYFYVCSIGTQLENLFKTVPSERILVLVLDDLKENPRREWLRIMEFLQIYDDNRKEFPVYNEGMILRNRYFYKVYVQALKLSYKTINIRKKIGLVGIHAIDYLRGFLFKKQRIDLDCNTRRILLEYLEPEISKIEKILGRKFNKWRKLC